MLTETEQRYAAQKEIEDGKLYARRCGERHSRAILISQLYQISQGHDVPETSLLGGDFYSDDLVAELREIVTILRGNVTSGAPIPCICQHGIPRTRCSLCVEGG